MTPRRSAPPLGSSAPWRRPRHVPLLACTALLVLASGFGPAVFSGPGSAWADDAVSGSPVPEADGAPVAGDGAEPAVGDIAEAEPGSQRRDASIPAPVAPPPVGVRYGEALEGRRMRLAYSWERHRYQGLMAGDDDITRDYARQVLGFGRTPRALDVTVHTVQVAFAPHPRVTLVVDVPFVQRQLERVEASGLRREADTEGVGDIGFAMIVPFIRKGREHSQVHLGFDAPTGSIRRSEAGQRLPYDSQIGNGSWDLEWGWTYQGDWGRLAWGGQAYGRHPVHRNGLDYRPGSRFVGTVWGAVRLFDGLSFSLRSEWEKQNNISGRDRALDPRFDPSENAKLRGGERISLAPGLSLSIPKLNGQKLGVEIAVPVHQRLDGPQLERDWSLKAAWQWVY